MSKKMFDVDCPPRVTTTGIINGKTSGVIMLNGLKYQWAYNLWEMMLNNTWFPKEVDITSDVNDYKRLLPGEKSMYDKVLAQLIFMDGLQTNNSQDNVNGWITAPEINMLIARQSFEEALHSQSYAVMVDSISDNEDEIYEMWRKDKTLFAKNKHIIDIYEEFASQCEDSDEAKVYMAMANQCLEGIYFYSGFAAIYALARNSKMVGSSQMIKFIQRDEVTHLLLFSNIIKTMKKEHPLLFTEKVIANCLKMVKEAVELEINWGIYITNGGILGLSPKIIENFIKYLANERMKAIGFPTLYPEIPNKNPISWFNDFSKFNDQKTNFFEGNVTNYSKGSLDINDF